ncbi:MoaD/ThiS family protein [Halorussus halophilus]|uniref:MoaD/ThiS family protein n=1 Tax=Halorussus halophilus TaxID=2650975 RepID=UPI0017887C72|nr:MoaD/ThiS family protein [Halorussus halophilus]
MTFRHVGVALMVALLVVSAGCSGMGGGGQDTPTESGASNGTTTAGGLSDTTTASETQSATTNDTANETTTAGEGTNDTSEDNSSNASEHDHSSHDHGNETTSESDSSDKYLSGEMTVVVGDDRLEYPSGSEDAGFWFTDQHKIWNAKTDGEVTLAEALAQFDVEASADSFSYDGETYAESDSGVSVDYRVNGQSVDPQEYVLQDGDEIWVTVETPDMERSVPGDHIDHEYSHIHGSIDFTVNGKTLDFSKDKYQTAGHSRYFHFEGGHADPWHAHSYSVTLQYAMATLQGLSVAEGEVTYNGTTYSDSDADTNVQVMVNGEEVDPSEYFLKDGDEVEIVVESES